MVLVKRVIAVGGQTVKGDADGDVEVSNNGPSGPWRTLDEPYVSRATGAGTPTRRSARSPCPRAGCG